MGVQQLRPQNKARDRQPDDPTALEPFPYFEGDPATFDEERAIRDYVESRPKAKKRDWSVWRNFFRFGWR